MYECIQCARIGDGQFYLISGGGREAVCEPCAQEWAQCDCCTDLAHESDLYVRKDRFGKERWLCVECVDRCGTRCEVLKWREETEYIRAAAEAAKEKVGERRAQVSEVRETLRVTLERQAHRNRTNV